jgi:hypothetical protein
MKYRELLYFLIVASILPACTKYDNSEFTDTPIIEAYLRPGDYLSMTVRRQIPFSSIVSYSGDDINALRITVKNNNKEYILTPEGNGRYISNDLIIKPGERYDMSFIYNLKLVSCYTEIPSKPAGYIASATSVSVMRMDETSGPPFGGGGWEMPEPLVLKWENDDASFYIVVVENMEAVPDPVRDFGDDTTMTFRFRKEPTTASGLTMRPQEFQFFGRHRLILYHVLPDYASLYKDNTNSSQDLTNPSTSIVNGYGIFTGLNTDTLFLQVEEQ